LAPKIIGQPDQILAAKYEIIFKNIQVGAVWQLILAVELQVWRYKVFFLLKRKNLLKCNKIKDLKIQEIFNGKFSCV
jgi:hypothetical protein